MRRGVISAAASVCLSLVATAPIAIADDLVQIASVAFLDVGTPGDVPFGVVRGSIGIIDYDRDGWYDVFFADLAGLPKRLFQNVPRKGFPGQRTFVDVSTQAGFTDDADGIERNFGGVVVFDYDNDGFSDIYTLGNGTDGTSGLLYHNNHDGTFTNTSVAAGVRLIGRNPASASAADFDHDGDVDLFVVSTGSFGRTLTLLENNGDSTFGLRPDLLPDNVNFTGITYAHTWNDYDHDGWEDWLICFNNRRPLLLKNVVSPTDGRMLVDATDASGFTSVGPAPMGIAVGDINGDGWMDLAITDAITGTYYQNLGGTFYQIKPYRTFFGWGTTYIDAENDGDLDNYQAGSFGAANIDWLLCNNGDGTFFDARAALNTPAIASQQCARVDYDNDGLEDVITINPGRPVSVYHNKSSAGNNWSMIRLVGTGGVSHDAVGARVLLTAGGKTQVREMVIGSSYSATEDPRLHFGLGQATVIDRIEITWPLPGRIQNRSDMYEGPFPVGECSRFRPRSSAPPTSTVRARSRARTSSSS